MMHSNRSIPPPPTSLSIRDQAFHEAFIRINQIPNELLKKLNDIPAELTHFIQQLPTIQWMESTRQQLTKRTRHLAKKNLTKEPELINARTKLSETFAELAPLREKYLAFRQGKHDDSPSSDLALAKLQSAAHESERLNDEMVETFFRTCRNDQDVDVFVKNFLRNRQETVELRFLAEKFFHLYQIEKRKF